MPFIKQSDYHYRNVSCQNLDTYKESDIHWFNAPDIFADHLNSNNKIENTIWKVNDSGGVSLEYTFTAREIWDLLKSGKQLDYSLCNSIHTLPAEYIKHINYKYINEKRIIYYSEQPIKYFGYVPRVPKIDTNNRAREVALNKLARIILEKYIEREFGFTSKVNVKYIDGMKSLKKVIKLTGIIKSEEIKEQASQFKPFLKSFDKWFGDLIKKLSK